MCVNLFFPINVALEFSAASMQKPVTMMTQLNSLVTQCDAYMRGQFDCPSMADANLFEK